MDVGFREFRVSGKKRSFFRVFGGFWGQFGEGAREGVWGVQEGFGGGLEGGTLEKSLSGDRIWRVLGGPRGGLERILGGYPQKGVLGYLFPGGRDTGGGAKSARRCKFFKVLGN